LDVILISFMHLVWYMVDVLNRVILRRKYKGAHVLPSVAPSQIIAILRCAMANGYDRFDIMKRAWPFTPPEHLVVLTSFTRSSWARNRPIERWTRVIWRYDRHVDLQVSLFHHHWCHIYGRVIASCILNH
jgi:hypothetical protein